MVQVPGPPRDEYSSSMGAPPLQDGTSIQSGPAKVFSLLCAHLLMKVRPPFPRMATGWPTHRTHPAGTKSTRSPIRGPAEDCKYRPKAALNPSGLETDKSCSTAAATR